jgi:hypothetical protein
MFKSLYAIKTFFVFLFFSTASLYSLEGKKDQFLVVNVPKIGNIGFFALFNVVLGALDYYDKGGCAGIKIEMDWGEYVDPNQGPNWWEYFFEPIHLGERFAPSSFLSWPSEVQDLAYKSYNTSRNRSYEIIKKYVHLKPEIEDEIESIFKEKFSDSFMIGIHHRGTDKYGETPIVPYLNTLKALNYAIINLTRNQRANLKIFVATDDQNFLAHLLKTCPYQIVFNDFVRSPDHRPVHYGNNWHSSNFQKGKEVLIDCLLLSKCNILIRPEASSVSLTATKFNPQMKDIVLPSK